MARWIGQGAAILFGLLVAAMAAIGSLHVTFGQPTFTGAQLRGSVAAGTPAPDFTLTDAANGRPLALHQLWGKPVLLFFVGPGPGQPSGPAALLRAVETRLGPRVRDVRLVVVNADALPLSTSEVAAWALRHRLFGRVLFLTGDTVTLDTIWSSYEVNVSIVERRPVYTFAAFVLAPGGAEQAAFNLSLTAGGTERAREATAVVRAVDPWISHQRKG